MKKIKQGPSELIGTHLPSEYIILTQDNDHNIKKSIRSILCAL